MEAVRRDQVGKLLVDRGVLPDRAALDDVLVRQGVRLPVASMAYVLGYAPERALVAAIATVLRKRAVVFDESVIHLDVIGALGRETALRSRLLPVAEDARHLLVAVADPDGVASLVSELERIRGKRVELLVALEISLARAIRGCYAARLRGDRYWVGAEAVVDPAARTGKLALVSPDDPESQRVDPEARAHRALIDDVTKEIAVSDLFLDDEELSSVVERVLDRAMTEARDEESTGGADLDGISSDSISLSSGLDTPWPNAISDVDDDETIDLIAELDAVAPPRGEGPPQVLIVDDDIATSAYLAKELQPLGYVPTVCADGEEALRAMRSSAPDLVVCDVMLPEIDGFKLCRAIKRSRTLGHVPVVLMSAVIDSGRVTDDVLARYGADAYLEKPLDVRRVHRVVRDLLGKRRGKSASGETGFQSAIQLYQRGDVDGAVRVLRAAVDADPSSAKYRFVLANLLQRKAQVSEAIDEYESVVQLEPEYFPALTRLAYLYYKQGLRARAVDTWRRALPLCSDPHLRRNIELFMRKLIAEMGAVTGAG